MLIDDLESDGKLKVGLLRELYKDWSLEDGFSLVVAEAVASGVENLEYNGGALLKEYLKDGGELSRDEWEVIIGGLSPRMHWTCQLNVCVALQTQREALGIDTVAVAAFLRDVIDAGNAFAKAWAISAFWSLGRLYLDYEDEAREYVAQGKASGEKCVMARMRNLKE